MKSLILAALLLTTPAAAADSAFSERWATIMEDLSIMEMNYHGAFAPPRVVKTDRIRPKTDDDSSPHEPVAVPVVPLVRRKVAAKTDACTKVGKRKVMVSRYRWKCREA